MKIWKKDTIRYCLMNGVRFVKQSSFYRGLVLKRNRRGKNHEADLPEIPSFLLGSVLNKPDSNQ